MKSINSSNQMWFFTVEVQEHTSRSWTTGHAEGQYVLYVSLSLCVFV